MLRKDYHRDMVKSNILRKVLLRLDYKGIVKIEDFIEKNSDWFRGYFGKVDNSIHNDINIDISDLNYQTLSQMLSLPIKEVIRQEIYSFTENTFYDENLESNTKDIVTLKIGKYFTTLEIECNEYNSINPYFLFFKEYIDRLINDNKFISIKRLGLRKISSNIFTSKEALFDCFDKKYYYFSMNDDFNTDNFNRLDVLYADHSSPIVNFRRRINQGKVTNEQTQQSTNGYLAFLDLDGYLDEQKIIEKLQSNQTLISMLEGINEMLFTVFINTVTDSFLEKHTVYNGN